MLSGCWRARKKPALLKQETDKEDRWFEPRRAYSGCSNRAATRVENTRTEQKTAPLRYSEFALYKQSLEEVRKHKKRLCCLRTAEVTSSSLVGSTLSSLSLQVKRKDTEDGKGYLVLY